MELEHSHEREAIRRRLTLPPPAGYLRDWIYGGIDGAITTFAIVAGVVGGNLSWTVVLVLGVANLIADGFSMAASNYSGTKSDRDNYDRLHTRERRHIGCDPDGEREEIRQIFQAKGFSGADLERAVSVITADEVRWIETMLAEEYGLSRVQKSPAKAGLCTFVAFVVAGAVPLLSYLPTSSLMVAAGATGIVFFMIGAIKSRWSTATVWGSGLETFAIGMGAAAIAYSIGYGLSVVVETLLV